MNENLRNSEVFISTQLKSDYTWLDKAFSKMETDSFRIGILLIIVSALGLGVLTFHKIFIDIGIINAILLIFLISFNFILSSDIIIYSLRFAANIKSISQVVEAILGKFARKFYDFFVFIYFFLNSFTILLAFFLVSYDLFGEQFNDLVGNKNNDNNFTNFKKYFSGIAFIIVYPVFFINNSKYLKYGSFFSLISFGYLFLLTLIQFPDFYYNIKLNHPYIEYNYASFNYKNILKSIGVLLFTFNCLTNFFGRISIVGNPRVKNLKKIFKRSFVVLSFIFCLIGLTAYLSLGPNSKQLEFFILRDFSEIYENDYFMSAGKIFLLISSLVTLGLILKPFKKILFKIFKKKKTCFNIFISTIICFLLFLACFFYQGGIYLLFVINGLFPGILLVWIYPGFLALRIKYVRNRFKVFLLVCWILVGLAVFVSGFVFLVFF